MNEEEAFLRIQKLSRDSNVSMEKIAQSIITGQRKNKAYNMRLSRRRLLDRKGHVFFLWPMKALGKGFFVFSRVYFPRFFRPDLFIGRSIKMSEEVAKIAIIASKGTLDMAYPPLILASAAAALYMEAQIFFTFYGLNIIHKKKMHTMKVFPHGNAGMPGLFQGFLRPCRACLPWPP